MLDPAELMKWTEHKIDQLRKPYIFYTSIDNRSISRISNVYCIKRDTYVSHFVSILHRLFTLYFRKELQFLQICKRPFLTQKSSIDYVITKQQSKLKTHECRVKEEEFVDQITIWS